MPYTAAEKQAMKDYLWRVEDGLNTASRDHFWGLGTPRPAEISEEDWRANIAARSTSLTKQWQMLRDLKKQYGIK
jgi:hypothetical protein